MKTVSKVGLLVAGLVAAAAAQAGQGDLVARVRATWLDFDNGQNSLPVLVKADSRLIPEVDFDYYLTDNVSTEPASLPFTLISTFCGYVSTSSVDTLSVR